MLASSIRLQLLIGQNVPTPAPYSVVKSLVNLEVQNNDRDRDGFQMTFTLGKDPLRDYGLLRDGLLNPPNRVIITVIIGVLPQVLIDGKITRHQVIPSEQPGQSRLMVTGEDISLELDLEHKQETYANLSDSDIVTQIVSSYGLVPEVTRTSEVPVETERITSQQGTDLNFIQELARRNNHVFYIESTAVAGVNTAYWGPENRQGTPQPSLTANMGSRTTIEQIQFDFNALEPEEPQVSIIEPRTGLTVSIPVPDLLSPPLTSQPATPLRKTQVPDTAKLNPIQAALHALVAASSATDTATATGTLDTVRYGRALRSRRLVDVRGVGQAHNGTYYVKKVTHRIKLDEYKQDFTLAREGRGAVSPGG